MRVLCLLLGLLVSEWLLAQPIGSWREHLPYNSCIDLANAPDRLFVATPYSLFSIGKSDARIVKYSKVDGLSETGIRAIHFDIASNNLLVAYTNSNLDLLTPDDRINIPDLSRATGVGDKTIHAIEYLNGRYYLSTGLGIVLVDPNRKLIPGTWRLGSGGRSIPVRHFAFDALHFYAATEEGLKSIARTGTNPANPVNWEVMSGIGGLPAGPCSFAQPLGNELIAVVRDTIYRRTNNQWTIFHASDWPLISARISEGKLLLCQRKVNGQSRVLVLNADGTDYRSLTQLASISYPNRSMLVNGEVWLADFYEGVTRFPPAGAYQTYSINSPQGLASGQLLTSEGHFFATAGSVNASWNYQYNGDGVYALREGTWKNYNRYEFSVLDSVLDLIDVAYDKRNRSLWAASYGGGVIQITANENIRIFKQGAVLPAIGDPTSYRVSGLCFDAEQNLWFSNYGADRPLGVRTRDSNWFHVAIPFPLPENALGQIRIDPFGYKWIVSPKGGGLILYDAGASITTDADDRWRWFRNGVGNGNLPSNQVNCLSIDRDGVIWVGTSNGIALIDCLEEPFNATTCEAFRPVVSNGPFAGYLFNGQNIKQIAVDGANRKWVATASGVFLIDARGEKVILHFTSENSALLSNDVLQVVVDGTDGEVYFATNKGICSYRADATAADESTSGLLVYPNPVPPGYTGTIAIRGLSDQSLVKITELDGRLVYQTRALGGQATWNGTDYTGKRVASGAYLVLITDANGKAQRTGRIFFIE
ncbi:MAG: two-component regulator propeller domain-containing protein [Bacteroidota bacterium]